MYFLREETLPMAQSKRKASSNDNSKSFLEKLGSFQILASHYWEQLLPLLRACMPHIETGLQLLSNIYSTLIVVYIIPYWDAVFASVLLFFGGQFAMIILTYQAFRVAGGTIIMRSFKELKDSYKVGIYKYLFSISV
jgi:hypothetical protein